MILSTTTSSVPYDVKNWIRSVTRLIFLVVESQAWTRITASLIRMMKAMKMITTTSTRTSNQLIAVARTQVKVVEKQKEAAVLRHAERWLDAVVLEHVDEYQGLVTGKAMVTGVVEEAPVEVASEPNPGCPMPIRKLVGKEEGLGKQFSRGG